MKQEIEIKPFLTVHEIGISQSLSDKTVRKLLDNGTMPGGYRVGRSRRIVRAVYEEWIYAGGGEGPKSRQGG